MGNKVTQSSYQELGLGFPWDAGGYLLPHCGPLGVGSSRVLHRAALVSSHRGHLYSSPLPPQHRQPIHSITMEGTKVCRFLS